MSFEDEIKQWESVVVARIEAKVKAASTVAAGVSLVVSLLSLYVFHGVVPDWVTAIVGTLVTGLSTLLAGWLAKHTPRPSDATGGTTAPSA